MRSSHLIFYYDTPTARDAQTARIDEKYIQDKESGDKGEERVEYALKWLDKSFIQIEKRSKDRVGNSCIILLNKEFIDEKQEYDHIVVSPKGIFCIETKNYNGKLIIDSQGNWIRRRNGEEEGIRNPLQQIRQHEKVLKSFLPATCNIVSLICIANDNAVIEGAENCTIPIIKCDMIVEYIENNECKGIALSEGDVESCVKAIYNHMV